MICKLSSALKMHSYYYLCVSRGLGICPLALSLNVANHYLAMSCQAICNVASSDLILRWLLHQLQLLLLLGS